MQTLGEVFNKMVKRRNWFAQTKIIALRSNIAKGRNRTTKQSQVASF